MKSMKFGCARINTSSSSIMMSDCLPPHGKRGRETVSADAWQLFADEHIDDTLASEIRVHHHAARDARGDAPNNAGILPERMSLQRGTGPFRCAGRHDNNDLALIGEVERIEAKDLAKAFDLLTQRRRFLVDLDPDAGGLGNLVENRREPATRGIPDEPHLRASI